jgi:hypothetical protein
MTPQLVAFVRQGLVTAWKGLRLKYPVDGNPAWIYGSRDAHCFGRQARPGAVLWVCGRRPPDPASLVARIRVVSESQPCAGRCPYEPPSTPRWWHSGTKYGILQVAFRYISLIPTLITTYFRYRIAKPDESDTDAEPDSDTDRRP